MFQFLLTESMGKKGCYETETGEKCDLESGPSYRKEETINGKGQ